jgi:hypothetical protein
MARPYSGDLRTRVVGAVVALRRGISLGVGISTVVNPNRTIPRPPYTSRMPQLFHKLRIRFDLIGLRSRRYVLGLRSVARPDVQ